MNNKALLKMLESIALGIRGAALLRSVDNGVDNAAASAERAQTYHEVAQSRRSAAWAAYHLGEQS